MKAPSGDSDRGSPQRPTRAQHCHDEGENDSPGVISGHIQQLDNLLNAMSDNERESYEQACANNAALRTDLRMRMKFLRAEDFQYGLAAHRLTQYFDTIKELFGAECLGEEIALSNLSQQDQEALCSGALQVLPQPDHLGRTVVFFHETASMHTNRESMMRAAFYVLDVISRDASLQRDGIVRVRYDVGTQVSNRFDLDLFLKMEKFFRFAAPVKVRELHLIHGELMSLDAMAFLYESVLSDAAKATLRVHLNSNADFASRLETFGVPPTALPVDMAGRLRVENHVAWIAIRRATEISNAPETQLAYSMQFGQQQQPRFFAQPMDVEPIARQVYQPSATATAVATDVPATLVSANTHPRLGRSTMLSSFISADHALPASVVAGPVDPGFRQGSDDGSSNRTQPGVVPLSWMSDDMALSAYQSTLRRQIEAFAATTTDVQFNASRTARAILEGQVGLRCRHCSHLPEYRRAAGAVYYPGSLDMLYQAAQNLAKNHLCGGCHEIRTDVQDLLIRLRDDKRRASSGKEYWKRTAKCRGITEANGRLWFEKVVEPPRDDTTLSQSENT